MLLCRTYPVRFLYACDRGGSRNFHQKRRGGGHIVNILKFVGGPSKAENFVYVYMYNVQTVLYINLSRPPPCHAASVSVKVNRSMIEPTTSSANSWGRRPVTRPILKCNVFVLDMDNMYTLLLVSYRIKCTSTYISPFRVYISRKTFPVGGGGGGGGAGQFRLK